METKAVEIKHITKYFKKENIMANEDLSLSFKKGEITCIAGENGAGKSTLMKILYGLEVPTSGEILINGEKVIIDHPIKANKLGIGMVHQDFKLFNDLTIAENVCLGKERTKRLFFLDKTNINNQVQQIIDSHEYNLKANAKLSTLSTEEKQLVEIIKMLYRNVEIMIFDEPTAVLTEQETKTLFSSIKALAKENRCIILITHKIKEIFSIADNIAILRKGRLIGNYRTKEITPKELSSLIMGTSFIENQQLAKNNNIFNKEPIIQFKEVNVQRHGQNKPLLSNISFNSYRGEILGFCGVSGNGLGVIEGILAGMMPITSGNIYLKGEKITNLRADKLREKGLAFVPADRYLYGSALEATLSENLIINHRDKLKEKEAFSKKLMNEYQIKAKVKQKMQTLSGGNIQKAILAREIENMKDYIVLSNPTWGLDIAATNFIHNQIIELRNQGNSIILISSNVQEILKLSTTIKVLHNGEIIKSFENDNKLDKSILGEYMLGGIDEKK